MLIRVIGPAGSGKTTRLYNHLESACNAGASCVWICNHIKKANGLGIFAHPYWISDVYQVPEDFTDYMFETMPFIQMDIVRGRT